MASDKNGQPRTRKMEIVQKRLDDIRPYERNPRRNDHAVDAVAASIQTFGFKVPIVLDKKGVIVCGHTRYKAAQKLGLETVPCIVARHLTPSQARAYRLADNKVAELATWDRDALDAELAPLKEIFDMSLFGFVELSSIDEDTLNGLFTDKHVYVNCPKCGARLDVASGEAVEAKEDKEQ